MAVTSSLMAGYRRYEGDSVRELIHFFEKKLNMTLSESEVKKDPYTGKAFYLLKR